MMAPILDYLLLGLAPRIDRFYLYSFNILLACIVVFPILENIRFTLLEYRLGQHKLLAPPVENRRRIPFLCVSTSAG